MDPVKRAPARLRRFCEVLFQYNQPAQRQRFSVASVARAAEPVSLRSLIEGTVVAFVPPALPLKSGSVTGSKALVSFSRRHFELGVRVEADTESPTVFLIGFVTNVDAYWALLIGALNYQDEGPISTRKRMGIFSYDGPSMWLDEKFGEAIAQGCTFRLHSTQDTKRALRPIAQEWARSFGRTLDVRKLMSLTDYPWQYNEGGLDVGAGSAVMFDDPGDDGTLSFRVSMRFE